MMICTTTVALVMALACSQGADVLEQHLMWRSRVDIDLTMSLLQRKDIQEEIGLLGHQLTELNRIHTEYKQRAFRSGKKVYGNHPDRLKSHKAFMDFAKDMKSISARGVVRVRGNVEEILLPHQIKRLNELYVQCLGVNAFAVGVVRNKLLLSKEQKEFVDERLRKVKADKRRIDLSSFDPFGAFAPGGPPVPDDKKTVEKKALLSIMSQLNKDQLRIFKGLVGEPFSFSSEVTTPLSNSAK